MGYLGYKPADKPLTSADITDSIITSAKIVDGTIVNADINASAAIVASKLSGVGITEADMFRQTSNGTSNTTEATITGMTRVNSDGFDKIGTGMSESSGIFTFPSIGTYLINFNVAYLFDSGASSENYIYTTLDNSTYSVTTNIRVSAATSANQSGSGFFIFDVTSTTNCKVKFNTYATSSITRRGGSADNLTYVMFIRLGD